MIIVILEGASQNTKIHDFIIALCHILLIYMIEHRVLISYSQNSRIMAISPEVILQKRTDTCLQNVEGI